MEKHFLQFTVRKNNFFKLLRKKNFFKLLWKKIGFESFCRTLRQQLRSRNEKNGLFQLTGESRPPLEWKSPLLRYKYKAQLKPSCTSSLHSTLLWLSPLTWTTWVQSPAWASFLIIEGKVNAACLQFSNANMSKYGPKREVQDIAMRKNIGTMGFPIIAS